MKEAGINWDALGIVTSLACAIHCAILPLIIGTLPVLGINIIHNRVFEGSMILLSILIGGISLVHGYRKHHGRLVPLILFSAGSAFLLAKHYWHAYELTLLPFAVLLIISAHLTNLRINRLAESTHRSRHPAGGG